MPNKFIKDASFFIKKTGNIIIKESLSEADTIENILFFALGMERVLKGILANLNPIYVLKSQDFKNSVSILYKEHLLPNFQQNQEIANKPDTDVLTFKLSLLRAKSISKTTEKHTALLLSLSNSRDIIVHNDLSLLDIDKLKKLLLRDFYPLMRDYCSELGLQLKSFVDSEIKLSTISSKHQESIEEKVKMKLESHKKRWEQMKSNPGFVAKRKQKTSSIQQGSISRDSYTEIFECPACLNDALLTVDIDFDYTDDEVYPIGAFVSKLRCLYCKLFIEDYDEIDYLNLNEYLSNKEDYYL
jgi:hypothetical protein